MSDRTRARVVSPSSVLLRPGWAFKMTEGLEIRSWIGGPGFIVSGGEASWRVINYHIFRIFLK